MISVLRLKGNPSEQQIKSPNNTLKQLWFNHNKHQDLATVEVATDTFHYRREFFRLFAQKIIVCGKCSKICIYCLV